MADIFAGDPVVFPLHFLSAGGQVIGVTDDEGGNVLDSPYTPENYASTVYEKLGIDRATPLYTNTNRPVHFAQGADPIAAVMGRS